MSRELVKITDYNYNLEFLLSQYADSQNFRNLLKSSSALFDDIEEALFEIRDLFFIDEATGRQLDIIGSIFFEERGGRDDADYRLAIKGVAAFTNSGTPNNIISILEDIYNVEVLDYSLPPDQPATYSIIIKQNPNNERDVTASILDILSPAGVQGYALSILHYADQTTVFFADMTPVYISYT